MPLELPTSPYRFDREIEPVFERFLAFFGIFWQVSEGLFRSIVFVRTRFLLCRNIELRYLNPYKHCTSECNLDDIKVIQTYCTVKTATKI